MQLWRILAHPGYGEPCCQTLASVTAAQLPCKVRSAAAAHAFSCLTLVLAASLSAPPLLAVAPCLTPSTVCRFGTDEEKLEGLAADLGIKTLPAFRFYKDGKNAGIKEIVGYKKKPLTDAVEEFAKQ